MYRQNVIPYVLAFILLIIIGWLAFLGLPEAELARLPAGAATADLRQLDFEDQVYTSDWVWESWKNELYTPADFDGEIAPRQPDILPENVGYATHRLRLMLKLGVIYALDMRSSDYSMRLFVNGSQIGLVGLPGPTREESIPRVKDVVYYFTPQIELVEVIVQTSNFVHREGGGAPSFTIGTADNIAHREHNRVLRAGVILGCLFTASLYNLAIFY